MTQAQLIRVRGVVQGVGFRPYVFRLAQSHALTGWVLNGDDGVQIHIEGSQEALLAFIAELSVHPPPAATIATVDVCTAEPAHYDSFAIRESSRAGTPSVRISPDLPVCDACLRELFDEKDRRFGYPYINCTDCGPRYSIVKTLPYDRARTTMAPWTMCEGCAAEYADPEDRRFHAQPVACPVCGPHVELMTAGETVTGDRAAIAGAAELLRAGRIVAIKGLGGYHLACDAASAGAVAALRERKYRKEKPFAVIVRDVDVAAELVTLTGSTKRLLASPARPIVLAPARVALPGVAPDSGELGVMLAYTPLHHLLFASGAPRWLVMTSGNRSSEPIAYRDDEATELLDGIADAMLVGARPIARRVEDSVVRDGCAGPVVLRRSRGYAPGAVAQLPCTRPVLAVGGDLKNTITLVVDGQAYVSQHIGDLDHATAAGAFRETVADLLSMYDIAFDDLLIVSDAHPQYSSSEFAKTLPARAHREVQHHRAHVASVLAERSALDERVLGVALDGTGYGDDGTIWGGEFFAGSVHEGFKRVAHLRPAMVPGGDAAARYPVQAAAGFLSASFDRPHDLGRALGLPDRYAHALELIAKQVRVFQTTSTGRLFDAAAAIAGFTGAVSYEAQGAIWFEQLARRSTSTAHYRVAFDGRGLDWRPLLCEMVRDVRAGTDLADVARAFHRGFARGLTEAIESLCAIHDLASVVLSGGVCQNEVLMSDLMAFLDGRVQLRTNSAVPCNDGGLSLGQAALGACMRD